MLNKEDRRYRMFLYEEMCLMEAVKEVKPDIHVYEAVKKRLEGCKTGLQSAMHYIRESYMMVDGENRNAFALAAVRKLNDMEVLAELLHRLHGLDDWYFDAMLDTDPVYHEINEQPDKKQGGKYRNHDDLSAALLCHMKQEQEICSALEACRSLSRDEAAKACFQHLAESTQATMTMLSRLLDKQSEHAHAKDFGEAPSFQAWDLATSNYFDKPNPEFFHRHH